MVGNFLKLVLIVGKETVLNARQLLFQGLAGSGQGRVNVGRYRVPLGFPRHRPKLGPANNRPNRVPGVGHEQLPGLGKLLEVLVQGNQCFVIKLGRYSPVT